MMRARTKKRAAIDRQASDFRYALVMEIGACELCGTRQLATLALHEAARGPARVRAQSERCAVLCLCNPTCHRLVERWPIPKQLALLKVNRPNDYDLPRFNGLVNRQVSEEEVTAFRDEVELEIGKRLPEFDLWA